MRIFVLAVCFLFVFGCSSAFANSENLDLMRITVPMDWEITSSDMNKVVLERVDKKAKFIYKKIPVHVIDLDDYARGLMKASGGYNFTKRTDSIYYFEYLHGDKFAWTLVTYFKNNRNIFCTQSGIGESPDYTEIMESISLK